LLNLPMPFRHGAGSAMHSVSVLNVLRQRALPGVGFRNPAQVLRTQPPASL